jgi:hypothetical protein
MLTMDGPRFDAWTRGLRQGLPRRGALKTLVGMALAGAMTRSVSRDAAANCSEEGDDCGMGCCEGLVCDEGYCQAAGEPDGGQNRCGNNNEAESVRERGTVEGDGCKKPKCEGNGCNKKKHDKKREKRKRGR